MSLQDSDVGRLPSIIATTQEQHGTSSTFRVVFKSSRREDEHIDLQLTRTVSAGGYSWWRLNGYETWGDGDKADGEVPLDGAESYVESHGDERMTNEEIVKLKASVAT